MQRVTSEVPKGRPPEKISQGFRILLAEDDRLTARVVRDVLNTVQKPSIEIVESGEDTLELLRRARTDGRPYGVLITDKSLAGEMGGLALAKAAKEQGLVPYIILLTASAQQIAREYTPAQLEQLGINVLLAKGEEMKKGLIPEIQKARRILDQQLVPQT